MCEDEIRAHSDEATPNEHTMLNSIFCILLAAASFAVASLDIADELAGQWKMGLRPRQASANLQAFTGSLGGEGAPAVSPLYRSYEACMNMS